MGGLHSIGAGQLKYRQRLRRLTIQVRRYVIILRAKFGAALLEAIEDRKQAILTVERARLVEISLHLRDEDVPHEGGDRLHRNVV